MQLPPLEVRDIRMVRLINESTLAIDFIFYPSADWASWMTSQVLGVPKGDLLQFALTNTKWVQAADATWFDAGGNYLDTITHLPPDAILHLEGVVHATTAHHVTRRKTIQSQVVWVQLVVHSFSAYE